MKIEMVCDWNCYVFLFFIVLVIHTSPTRSQVDFCNDPTDDEGRTFLDVHNDICSTVRPSASNMNLLSWDPVLYLLAQKMANECFQQTSMPNPYGSVIGINQALTYIRPTVENRTIEGLIRTLWASEGENYNFKTNRCEPGQTCFRYKQIVWTNTKFLGCAISSTPCRREGGNEGDAALTNTVCLYSPRGNIEGERPYLNGPSCTRCEPGRQSCINNLCAPTQVFQPING